MMAHCPNCGKHLRLVDWKPDCPHCHVNMVYFKSNERLLEETEAAEIAHALSQPGIDRARASFFGSPFAIIRLVLSLLPIAGLFAPLYFVGEQPMNIVGIVKTVTDADMGAVLGGVTSGNPTAFALVFLALSVVMILVCLGLSTMTLGKHGKIRNLILQGVMMLFAALSELFVTKSQTALGVQRSFGWGSLVYLGIMAVLAVYSFLAVQKGLIKPVYSTCLIGGLPSEEYFRMVDEGESELAIRTKMVETLTKMQDEVREAAKKAEQEAFEERAHRKQ